MTYVQVWGLLGVKGESIVDGRVRRHHRRLGGDRVGGCRDDSRRPPALHPVDMAAENETAVAPDGFGQTRHVLDRVELSLPGEAQAGSGIERRKRGVHDLLDRGEPRPPSHIEFQVQHVLLFTGGEEQIPIHAFEIARDPFPPDRRLDHLDGAGMAFRG